MVKMDLDGGWWIALNRVGAVISMRFGHDVGRSEVWLAKTWSKHMEDLHKKRENKR